MDLMTAAARAKAKRLFDKGIKDYDIDLDIYLFFKNRGEKRVRPKLQDYVPFYQAADGKMYTYLELQEQEVAVKKQQAQNQLSAVKPPAYNTVEFQNFLVKQFNGRGMHPDYVLLPEISKKATAPDLLDQLKKSTVSAADKCKGPGSAVRPHQAVVYAMARLRATNMINSPGLLAMHSTGAGKTLEGLSAILAFWNKLHAGRPYGIFCVSTRSNQDSNSIRKLAQYGLQYFSRFESTLEGLPRYPFTPGTTLDRAEKSIKQRISLGLDTLASSPAARKRMHGDKREDLYTYVKLSNDCRNGLLADSHHALHHALIVVDEIQFLLSPPPDEGVFTKEYRHLRDVLTAHRSLSSTWVLGMTATPGGSLAHVCAILNAVRGRPGFVTPQHKLSVRARGLLSYAQVQSDLHHFPKLETDPQCLVIKPEHAYAQQYLRAIGQYSRFEKIVDNFDSDILQEDGVKRRAKGKPDPKYMFAYDPEQKDKYYQFLRKCTNYLQIQDTEDKIEELEGEFAIDGIRTRRAKDGNSYRSDRIILFAFSPKLTALVKNIATKKGKHYVYTSSKMTSMLIASMLQEQLGMEQLQSDCDRHRRTCTTDRPKHGKQYFIMVDNVSSARKLTDPDLPLDTWEYKDFRVSRIAAAKRGADAPGNIEGDHVKVILATHESYKGVDLKGLRHIHLLEPMVDLTDLIQLAGRGPRFCSHQGLKPKDWLVTLYSYRLSIAGLRDTSAQADAHVLQQSIKRYEMEYGMSTDDQLQKASVDYKLFKDNLHLDTKKQFLQLASTSCIKPPKPKKPKAETPKKAVAAVVTQALS